MSNSLAAIKRRTPSERQRRPRAVIGLDDIGRKTARGSRVVVHL
jgi:hypothetical protein